MALTSSALGVKSRKNAALVTAYGRIKMDAANDDDEPIAAAGDSAGNSRFFPAQHKPLQVSSRQN